MFGWAIIGNIVYKVVASAELYVMALPQANYCSGSAVAAARLYGGGPASPRRLACGSTYAINSPVEWHISLFFVQLGVRFILLAAQLATTLFLK